MCPSGGSSRAPVESTGALLVVLGAPRSVARLLRAATVGGTAGVGRTTGRRELAVGLPGGQAAAFPPLFELHPRRLLDRREEPADGPTGAADVVHPLGHRRTAVGQLTVAVLVHRAQGLVDLDELAARQPADHAGLDAVLEDLTV